MVAVGDDFGVAVELREPLGQLIQRDQPGSLNVDDVPFVRLPDVDEDKVPGLCPASPAAAPRR